MKNEIKDINEVIIRFLDGTATGEEKVFLFNWLKQSEKNRNEFSEVRDLWLLGNTIATDDLETEIALERFKNRIQSTESGLRKNRFVFRKHFVPFLRVAAVFLMLFTVGSVFYYWGSSSVPKQPDVMNRLLTANGSKGRFVLPDSTVVWLNSNSLLEYPETFSSSAREVSLSGEAYFEVRRNEKLPFRVQAGEMKVEVLGTEFNVQAYSGDEVVKTTLNCGKVRVMMGKEALELVLDQQAVCDLRHRRFHKIEVNANYFSAWKDGKFIFEDEPLENILNSLARWYNISVFYQNEELKNFHFTGDLERYDDFSVALRMLEKATNIRFLVTGRTVVVQII